MICDNCKKRPASIHVTKIHNGQAKEYHLCSVCAEQNEEIKSPFGISDVFSSLFEINSQPVKRTKACPVCGYTISQLNSTGLLGCPECYNAFEQELSGIIKNVQGGNAKHVDTDISAETDDELSKLKKELNDAVIKEQYEVAATLRDKIRDIENNHAPKEGSK